MNASVIKDIIRRYMANSLTYNRAKRELQDAGLDWEEIEKLLEAVEYAEDEDVDELVDEEEE